MVMREGYEAGREVREGGDRKLDLCVVVSHTLIYRLPKTIKHGCSTYA